MRPHDFSLIPQPHTPAPHFASSGKSLESWAIVLTVLLFVSIISIQLLGLPNTLGLHIPAHDPATDHIWAVVFSLFVAVSIFLLPVARIEAYAILICWLGKCFVGLVGMLWYENYYSFLDSYSYFQEGTNYLTSPEPFIFGDGTNLTIHLSSLFQVLLPGEFHTLKQCFSLIGLVGIYCFYRAVCICVGKRDVAWLLGLGLFPSILFWTSTLGKDPVVFVGISFFLLGSAMVYRRVSAESVVILLAGIAIAACIRPWLSVIMAPSLLLLAYRSRIGLIGKVYLFAFVLGIISVSVISVADRFDFSSQSEALERLDAAARGWSADGDSGQVIQADLTNPLSYAGFLPLAVFTTLFRPVLGEISSVFGLLSGVENLLLLYLAIRVAFRLRLDDLQSLPVQFGLLFLTCWLVLYAPVAYQNLGTAVRFKLQILPLFLVLLLYLGRSGQPVGHKSGRNSP